MTYEQAIELVEEYPRGRLEALAEENRLEAIRPAWAHAIVWRAQIDNPGFAMPLLEFVSVVEYLIGEPVWTERHYYTEESRRQLDAGD